MDFSEVIGQHEAIARLKKMVDEGHVPHAMLLCGPNGCGKKALAMALASYLLTEGGQKINPSLNITNARAMLKSWNHPDLHFSYPVYKPKGSSADRKVTSEDYATEWHEMLSEGLYFTFEQWLSKIDAGNQQAIIYEAEGESLIKKMSLKSSQGGYKVSIVWLPEKMTQKCSNSLLKLIEEPPSQTVFIMVSEEPSIILETIRSRAQRIDIRRIDTADIEQALVSLRGVDEDTAHRIARSAMGSWNKALEELTASGEGHEFFNVFVTLMRLAYQRRVKELKDWSDEVASMGREKQKRLLDYFGYMVRENFIYNLQNPELNYMTAEEEDFAKRFARFINEANIIEIDEEIQKVRKAIAQNAAPRVEFYDFALKIIVLLLKK